MIKRRTRRKNRFLHKKNPQIYSRTQAVVSEKPKGGFFKYLVFLFLGGFIYFLLFSPFLKIKGVNYSGDEQKKSSVLSKIEDFKKGLFAGNVLFMDEEDLKKVILEDKTVKEISLKKDYVKRTISVDIKAQSPIAIFEERGKKYLLDDNGIIYKEVGEGEEGIQNLIKINYKLSEVSEIGSKVLDERVFNFTKEILQNFENKISDKLLLIEFENSTNEMTLIANSNYKIFLDTKRDPNQQLESAAMVKKDADKKKKRLEYVDLRVESRVFYKFR